MDARRHGHGGGYVHRIDTMLVRWFPQRAAVGKLLFQTLSTVAPWRRKPRTTAAPDNAPRHTAAATRFVACALREKTWQLGCTTGQGPKPRARTVTARHPERRRDESAQAKRRLGLPATAPVVRGSAAGRAGFWRQRFLQGHGSTPHVVDAAAMEVNRRRRRAKSDGVAVRQGRRYAQGARHVWQVVQVPAGASEAQRHLHRDLAPLKQERARTTPRIPGVRSRQGLRGPSRPRWPEPREAWRLWDGAPMPPGLRRRVLRVEAPHTVLSAPSAAVAAARRAQLQASTDVRLDQVRQGRRRTGRGSKGAWLVVLAFVGWRACTHRREVGG